MSPMPMQSRWEISSSPASRFTKRWCVCRRQEHRLSSDARRHFNTFNGNYKKLATVVTSVLIRAAINFMMRVSGVGQDAVLFNTEADALAWL